MVIITIKNLPFLSGMLLLGFCSLACAEGSKNETAVVKQFVPEGCEVDKIEKADLDGDSEPELVFTYTGEEEGLIVLKWNGVKYEKQWEYEVNTYSFEWLKVQDVTNDGKPEILLCWRQAVRFCPMGLAVFTWDGKTYKLLGPNDAYPNPNVGLSEFGSVDMPDVAPGMVCVYEFVTASTTSVSLGPYFYPRPYKWNGSKFVLHGIRDGNTFGCMKTGVPPEIDGELDDWGLEGIPVYGESGPRLEGSFEDIWAMITHVELGDNKHEVLFRPQNWYGILDLGAWFDTRWDDKMLYIVVQVADDKLIQEWQEDALYNGDHVEIWFDNDLTGDFDVAKANSDDFQIGISPGNFKEFKPSMYCWLPKTKKGNIKDAEVSAKRTNDGYILEAKIPFQFLGIEPKPEKMLGLTVLISDTDEKENPQKCMIGTSSKYEWGNPTTWDNFIFLE